VTAGLRSNYNAKQRAVAIAQNGISTPDASISSIVNSDITNGVNVYAVYTGILHILANDGLWTDAIKIIEVSSTASIAVSCLSRSL
jgi:6-phosphofructokinase